MHTTATQYDPAYTGQRRARGAACPSRRRAGRVLSVLAAALLLTAGSAAATPSTAAPATQTAAAQATHAAQATAAAVQAQATRAAAPVPVVLAVSVQGSLSHVDVVVSVTSTVTNHTN